MKRYKRFMDGVRAPGTLNQRLKELKTPKKQPAAWAKYGAVAAAFILVFGGAALGMHWEAQWSGRLDELFRQASYVPENVDAPQPDIAIVEPGETGQPGEKILEGYAVEEERAGVPVVHYYCLPYIDYGTSNETGEQAISMDWAIQEGAVERELTQEEIVALLGGADTVSTHLDWDAYKLTGRIWNRPDGSMLLAFLYGYLGPLDHFEFAVMDGELPPTCIVYAGSVTQEVRGLTVTADKYDGEQGCDRRASFMKDGYGYRFDLSSTDMEQAERLVSRLVCCVADERLALWSVDPSVETYTCPDCGQTFPVDRMRAHIHSFTSGDDGASSAEPYDPNEAAAPRYNAPAVSAGPIAGCGMPDVDKPPAMRVKCGGGSLESRPSSYNWSYSLKNGETTCVIACGAHPLDFQEAPSLTATVDVAKLSLSGSPTRLEAECWPDGERGNTSAGSVELSMAYNTVTQNYELELKQGGWIYQVSAYWKNGNSADYVFYIAKS